MKTEIINPLVDEDWDHLILQHPKSTFFHCAAWAKVLARTYRHEPLYLCYSRNEKLLALVPIMEIRSPLTGRRGVGLPFTDCCEPLVFEEEAWKSVLGSLSGLAKERRWKHFELRGGMDRVEAPSMQYYEHTLDLRRGPGELFSGFSSGSRRAIRKAEKSELRVEGTQSREALVNYYRLHVQTRKRHGLPPQPFSFFQNIQKEVIEPGLGFIVMAYLGSIAISGAVYFHFGKHAVYKFGASDRRFQEFRGNNLVMWKGIQLLAKGGFEKLHFGRTSFDNDGLRQFKLGWGSLEKPLAYLKCQTATGKWVPGRDRSKGFHNHIFGKLPLVLNRMAGALIYPHFD